MARTVVVEVDSREQKPLLFPEQLVWSPAPFKREMIKVVTEVVTLPFGDYRLAKYPNHCVIERKQGIDELAHNLLTKDRVRFGQAWDRFLEGSKFPVLLIEQTLVAAETLHAGSSQLTAPDVLGALYQRMWSVPHLTIIWSGKVVSPRTRRVLGGQLLRLMLAATNL